MRLKNTWEFQILRPPIDKMIEYVQIILKNVAKKFQKRMEDGGYMNTLAVYHSSIFQDFESYLRTKINLVEDDIRLVLDRYDSSFFTYEF